MVFLPCALLFAGHAFTAAPSVMRTLAAGPRRVLGGRSELGFQQPAFSTGTTEVGSVPSLWPWHRACYAALALACAARMSSSTASRSRAGRAFRGKAAAVVCRAADPGLLPPAPRDSARPQAYEPLASIPRTEAPSALHLTESQVGTSDRVDAAVAVSAAPAPVCAESESPACRHGLGRAARRVGAARFRCSSRRSSHFTGASAAAASAASERASRQRVGSRLQQAEATWHEVAPAPFDISRVRAQIQMGLQVTSGVSAMHGREQKSQKTCIPGQAKRSSVRMYQLISFLQARQGRLACRQDLRPARWGVGAVRDLRSAPSSPCSSL